MKTILLAVVMLLFPMAGFAAQCASSEAMALALTTKYGESAVIEGENAIGQIHIWINFETGTLSVTQQQSPGSPISCMIAVAQGARILPPPPHEPEGDPT